MFDESFDIQIFEKLLKELNYFNSFNIYSRPHFIVREVETDDEDVCPGEDTVHLTRIAIDQLEDQTYSVALEFSKCPMTPYGDKVFDCFAKSRYTSLFIPHEYDGRYRPSAIINESIDWVARFVAYYMKLLGYVSPADFYVDKYVNLSQNIQEIPLLDKAIKIPEPLRRAVAKVKELGLHSTDFVYLVMKSCKKEVDNPLILHPSFEGDEFEVWSDLLISEEDFKHRTHYQHFHHIEFTYMNNCVTEGFDHKTSDVEALMRFMTDYFMFNNPGVKTDEISVGLDFSFGTGDADNPDNDLCYTFYPDGTESSPEKLAACMAQLARNRND